jgi:CRISPR/Cas system-associated exonuclease Cas4 (RecB family)
MDTNITAAVFIAFLKCPTKAHLLAIGEPAPTALFTNIEERISSMYKSAVTPTLRVGTDVAEPLDFEDLWSNRDHEAIARPVDCETTAYNVAPPSHEPGGCQSRESTPSSTFVPVLFSPWDKPDISNSLLVCFGALALSQVTGILAATGTVIYGEGHRRKTVKIADHTVRTRQTIDAIVATCNSREPPPLILNRHCAVCDFQPRCRGLAIERDNLSLLSAMSGKERAKFHSNGIFSITQLSYGYRPRRRKRNRPDAERSKKTRNRASPIIRNDHKLKALAVKKNQIHIVETPSIKFDGTPTFLDVEGMPDRVCVPKTQTRT